MILVGPKEALLFSVCCLQHSSWAVHPTKAQSFHAAWQDHGCLPEKADARMIGHLDSILGYPKGTTERHAFCNRWLIVFGINRHAQLGGHYLLQHDVHWHPYTYVSRNSESLIWTCFGSVSMSCPYPSWDHHPHSLDYVGRNSSSLVFLCGAQLVILWQQLFSIVALEAHFLAGKRLCSWYSHAHQMLRRIDTVDTHRNDALWVQRVLVFCRSPDQDQETLRGPKRSQCIVDWHRLCGNAST